MADTWPLQSEPRWLAPHTLDILSLRPPVAPPGFGLLWPLPSSLREKNIRLKKISTNLSLIKHTQQNNQKCIPYSKLHNARLDELITVLYIEIGGGGGSTKFKNKMRWKHFENTEYKIKLLKGAHGLMLQALQSNRKTTINYFVLQVEWAQKCKCL